MPRVYRVNNREPRVYGGNYGEPRVYGGTYRRPKVYGENYREPRNYGEMIESRESTEEKMRAESLRGKSIVCFKYKNDDGFNKV